MRSNHMLMLALAAELVSATAVRAQATPYGPGFDGWTFTATVEKPGVVNCRAIRKVGGREDILAMRNDMKPYMSIKADGRKGKWPGSYILVPGKPYLETRVTAEADGIRLWFPMPDFGVVGEIAAAGIYEFSLADTEDQAKVPLGKRAGEAWGRVNECAVAHGH